MAVLPTETLNTDLQATAVADHNINVAVNRKQHKLSSEEILRLVSSLHASLDIKTIIKAFSAQVQAALNCKMVRYQHAETGIGISIGETADHSFNYHLCHGNLDLGEITFFRDDTFNSEEILVLEDYLCFVVTPIYNSIEHLKALQSAMHDPLTGVGNRVALSEALDHELAIAKRHEVPLSILALDIDFFKKVNDTYGHLGGDEYLQHLTHTIEGALRDSDRLFRTGGEEFIVLLSNTDTTGAVKLAERLRKLMEESSCSYKDTQIKATISLGISSFISSDTDISLLERADEALYRAKQFGRNRVCT